jgi:hypothetical protein
VCWGVISKAIESISSKNNIVTDNNEQHITKQEMVSIIEMIKSFDATESYFSYPFIKNVLHEILFPIPKCVIPKGKKLIRGRVHKNKEQFFHHISDISYNRQTFLIKDFGRANEPGQSVFYCSDNQNTAFIETCTVARDDTDKDFELITWGIWEVVKDIEISYVIGRENQISENQILNSLTNSFKEFLNPLSQETRECLLLLHDFISNQFQIESKGHHSLYKISCAFSNWIYTQTFLDNNGKETESSGIMYRSSIWPEEGMNIALKPTVVDNSLRLIDVRRDHILKRGKFYDGSNTLSAIRINIKNDSIEWF